MAFETIFKMSKWWSYDGTTTRAGTRDATVFMTVDKNLGANIEGTEDHDKVDRAFQKLESFDQIVSFRIDKNQLKGIVELGRHKINKSTPEVNGWIIANSGYGVDLIPLLNSRAKATFYVTTGIDIVARREENVNFAFGVNQDLLRSITKSIAKYNPSQGETHRNVSVGIYAKGDYRYMKLSYVERDHIVHVMIMEYVISDDKVEELLSQIVRESPMIEEVNRLEAEIVTGWGIGPFRACVSQGVA